MDKYIKKLFKIGLGVIGICVLLVLTIYCYKLSLNKIYTLINGDVVIIKQESSWEVTIPYTYQIKKENKVIIQETTFYYKNPDKENNPVFEVIYSDDRNMAAVVRKLNPKEVYILYDFETGTSVPYREGYEENEDYVSRRDKMLSKFNNSKYDYTFNKGI